MRKGPKTDYFQLIAPAAVLRQSGISTLDSVDIDLVDWGYRELSLWYWDLDTAFPGSVDRLTGSAVILPSHQIHTMQLLQTRGYYRCATSEQLTILVRSPEIAEKCLYAALPESVIR